MSEKFVSKFRFGWNAGRIWVSTPQNRTYRAWGSKLNAKTEN